MNRLGEAMHREVATIRWMGPAPHCMASSDFFNRLSACQERGSDICRRVTIAWVLLGLLIAGGGCKRVECNSQCARCGRSAHSLTKGGETATKIVDNDLSQWLSGYVSSPCKHVWVPVSGWSSSNNLHWDGISRWDCALRQIYGLRRTVSEAEIKQLLDQYFAILGISDEKQQHESLKEFSVQMADRVEQSDGTSVP